MNLISLIHSNPNQDAVTQALSREYFHKAKEAYSENEIAEARSFLEKALIETPQDNEALALLAEIDLVQGKLRSAIRASLACLLLDRSNTKSQQVFDCALQKRSGLRLRLDFNQITPPEQWPKVSLCMIVKNEEKHLADCLASVGDFCSEMIIVDTGSTDRTIEIAKEYGAIIRTFDWVDDFAAARNASIQEASGDYIFILDADERILPEDLVRLKWMAACRQADVYFCKSVDAGEHQPDPTNPPYDVMRMFRNGLGLQFESPLHHTIIPSAIRSGLRMAYTNLSIQHFGYSLSEGDWEKKNRRNLDVLEKAIARDEEDYLSRITRAMILYNLGQVEDAINEFTQVIPRLPDEYIPTPALSSVYTSLVENAINSSDLSMLELVINHAIVDFPDHSRLLTLLGDVILNIFGNPYLAAGLLQRAEISVAETGAAEPFEVKQTRLQLLARCCLLQGMQMQGKAYYLQATPDQRGESLRCRAQNKAQQGSWRAAADDLAGAMLLDGPAPGDYVDAAVCEYMAQNLNVCIQYCDLELVINPRLHKAFHVKAMALQGQGRVEDAHLWFIKAMILSPQNETTKKHLQQTSNLLNMDWREAIRKQGLDWAAEGQLDWAEHALDLTSSIAPDKESEQVLARIRKEKQ